MENIIYLLIKKNIKMRKLILVLFTGLLLTSCGKDKKNEVEATQEPVAVSDKYSVIIDGIYEKDDSISVVYQKDNFFLYDKPIWQAVKGSAMAQRITFDIPEGQKVENLSICVSKNKDQSYITIKNVTVKNGANVVLDGDNNKYNEYFATDPSFSWDLKNARFNLNHSNKYPPSIVGNDKLLGLLTK